MVALPLVPRDTAGEEVSAGAASSAPTGDTYLPHWGPIRRLIHALCKRSRRFNTVVAAVEMRLGREELLCLPQYMALCPTGQCNASCAFCSVTMNRTGIIKRQLPFEQVQRFIGPVARTIRMYGLEGNGEPTLYDRFDDLYRLLTADGATVYLITNAERLRPEQIDLLLTGPTDSINVSLNAATAPTHLQVMKLRHFDRVVDNIKRLTAPPENRPVVSVSFVVTADNIHEVQRFLDFAENELRADRILVRPLSEIANDQGSVEDFRSIVPYECDIRDMLDSVAEYLSDTPRRIRPVPPSKAGVPRRLDARVRRWLRRFVLGDRPPVPGLPTRIEIDPSAFRAFREDPPDEPVSPRGYADRLLAPRRGDWTVVEPRCTVFWHLSRATLACPEGTPPGLLWRSAPVPLPSDRMLTFAVQIGLEAGSLRLAVTTPNGTELAGQEVTPGSHEVVLTVHTGQHRYAILEFHHRGGALRAVIDFGQLRTPQRNLYREFRLPPAPRWQKSIPEINVHWLSGRCVRLRGHVPRGRYLLQSYSIRCLPEQTHRLPIRIDVRRGVLVVGVLSEDFSKWLHQFRFAEGRHEAVLEITTGSNRRVQFVIFSTTDGPFDADIDWLDSIQTASPEPGESSVPSPPADADQPADAGKRVQFARGMMEAVRRRLGRLLRPEIRYHCQKPWTDLHNFTVDGRMDVCCIATGPSQERYALGNLLKQDFQEVWNGERAREFRRTVNSGQPLPPCRRCPMLYAYQGPLFSPAHTIGRFEATLIRWLGWLPGVRLLRGAGVWLIRHILFRGFKEDGS
ncbi:MAG TPA: radical SAM/SPASM domain-containing protein [Gemmataceae bacterium]|nr:radical SAM/SPASM domain-containing protein [Gemmataceae bacterium]